MNPNQNIKITVATVTWNAAQVLPRTLRSVAEQDYPTVQHVIVDGCSSDDTLTLLRQYQEVESNEGALRHEIKVLSETDKGLYDAMNKAIALADGDYIVFLNAGDKFHDPAVLSRVAAAAKEGTPAVIYGDTDIVDDAGTFLRPRHLRPPLHLDWKSFRRGMLVCHQAFFARMDIVQRTPYNLRYRFSADYDWCIRIMKSGSALGLPCHNLGIVVADYLDGGMTVKNHRRSLMERLRIMAKHYGWTTTLAMHASFVFRAAQRTISRRTTQRCFVL